MKSIIGLIDELETKFPFMDQKKESVSAASVGWHIEHSLLAVIKMISATEHSNPADYKWQFNIKRSLVILTNKFPRGRARAPQSVMPGEQISRTTIAPLLEKAKQKAVLFETLGKDKFFHHLVFGNLRLRQARKIILIHTQHHLSIIKDIIRG
ncbi:MAG TPA: hypothetical protein PKC72_13080 [Chitinophagaceae bacterium]|nr:hypothetical protein [Chitinophagaceae bacterium]